MGTGANIGATVGQAPPYSLTIKQLLPLLATGHWLLTTGDFASPDRRQIFESTSLSAQGRICP